MSEKLLRQLTLFDAVVLGLGSIIGSGIFVSLGIATGVAGSWVLGAIMLAGLLALVNGLSAAQLAANHPVSGGAYEYGYRYLSPIWGWLAGWLFLLAKSASAASAALGFAAYVMGEAWVAIALVIVVGLLASQGVRQSSRVNGAIVGLVVLSLVIFVVCGWGHGTAAVLVGKPEGLLEATALMFVAYTGYGRITVLGEEVVNPRRTIPRALMVTLGVAVVLYFAVAAVNLGGSGGSLIATARGMDVPGLDLVVMVGAMAAMVGVLLNLLLGMSRVVLAMARRGDLPGGWSALRADRSAPRFASWVACGLTLLMLVVLRDIKLTWGFSAFSVLLYYGIMHGAALRLSATERFYSPWLAVVGLLACGSLAFWVERRIWLGGGAIVGVLVLVKWAMERNRKPPNPSDLGVLDD
jgi:basic amino acid/polyamine antiporter, APA family